MIALFWIVIVSRKHNNETNNFSFIELELFLSFSISFPFQICLWILLTPWNSMLRSWNYYDNNKKCETWWSNKNNTPNQSFNSRVVVHFFTHSLTFLFLKWACNSVSCKLISRFTLIQWCEYLSKSISGQKQQNAWTIEQFHLPISQLHIYM